MATKTRHFPLRFYELFFFLFLIISLSSRDRQQRHSTETLFSQQFFCFFHISKLHFVFFDIQILLYDILSVCLLFGNCAFGYSRSREGSVYILRKFFFSQAGFLFVLICFDFFSRLFFSKVIRQVFFFFFGFLPRQVLVWPYTSGENQIFTENFREIRFSRKIKRQDWLIKDGFFFFFLASYQLQRQMKRNGNDGDDDECLQSVI